MSWLEAELREQPDALARFLRAETAAARALADELAVREIRYVVIAARGSSDNAARYAQYLFGAVNRLPVALASPDIAAVVSEARAQGCPTIAITNDPTSRLAVAAERVVALWAGTERAVAATKTY